jgi:hypothetical protein
MTSVRKSKIETISNKKPNGKNTINPKSSDHIIYTQIDGMCVEFAKDSIKDNLGEIKIENFFPYVHKVENTFGYLLKLKNETNYRILSQANWRSILNGRINKLRPADKLPSKNRIKVFDKETEQEIDICYWPDNYYNSTKKNVSTGTKKTTKATSSGEKSLGTHQLLINKAPSIKNALEKSSFGFLISSVKKTNSKNSTTSEHEGTDGEITNNLIEHLFKNDKKRKRSTKSSELTDSSDEVTENPTKKQKLSDIED